MKTTGPKGSAAVLLVLAVCAGTCEVVAGQDTDRASQIYASSSKSVFLLVVKNSKGEAVGQGTGFLVSGGKIITNEHVAGAGSVSIDLGQVKIPTKVERVDTANDLAILTTGAEMEAIPLTLSSTIPNPGSNVFTIGNPAGLERSISTGVVSGVRDWKGRQLIQVTTPISPGSSGGPVFNSRGEVVGIAVGILEAGQNLNFAVPAAYAQKLLDGKVQTEVGLSSLLDRVDALTSRRDDFAFSVEADSDYQKIDRQIDEVLRTALEAAGGSFEPLFKVYEKARGQNTEVALAAAERAVKAKSTVDSNLALGQQLTLKARYSSEVPEQTVLRERGEKAFRTALQLSKAPNYDILYGLADVLEDRELIAEADGFFRRALDVSKAAGDTFSQAQTLRGLLRTADAQGQTAQVQAWFKALLGTGKAGAWDWQMQGERLDRNSNFREAATSYLQAAQLGGVWTNWCEAAGSFALVTGEEDAVLSNARKCISEGVSKTNSEKPLQLAHRQIANVLNSRGVYQEALSQAREAATLNSSDAWAFSAEAEALLGLRRFQEAISASNQAIRLSDGKFSGMHFNLGSAYFSTENWEFARQSFEKAAQLDPKDTAAAYNVALCYVRLGFYLDAAKWYEEVLRRNPNYPERQDILNRIQTLRR